MEVLVVPEAPSIRMVYVPLAIPAEGTTWLEALRLSPQELQNRAAPITELSTNARTVRFFSTAPTTTNPSAKPNM